MRDSVLRATIVALISVLCISNAVVADPSEKEIVLEFERETLTRELREETTSASVSKPAAGALPDALKVVVAPPEPALDIDAALETRAAVAATWAARQSLDNFGRRELFRAGFREGLKTAIDDPVMGRDSRRRGLRAGLQDPRGDEIGRLVGREAAAKEQPAIATESTFSAKLPEVKEPQLVQVFDDLPLRSFMKADMDLVPDAWSLYRSREVDDFYDADWMDASQAFAYWLDHHRGRAAWRALDDAEQRVFERAFKGIFSHQLSDLAEGVGEREFARGYESGWDYGVRVAREWSYRQGYREGLEVALYDRAAVAFEEVSMAANDEPSARGVSRAGRAQSTTARDATRRDSAYEAQAGIGLAEEPK